MGDDTKERSPAEASRSDGEAPPAPDPAGAPPDTGATQEAFDAAFWDTSEPALLDDGDHQPSPASGMIAGRYRIVSVLGEGGMATVYLADDVESDGAVALKVLRPAYVKAPVHGERFRR